MKYIIYLLFALGLIATIDYNGLNDPRAKMFAMACFGLLFVWSLFNSKSNQDKPNHTIFKIWMKWFILACLVNAFYGLACDRNTDIINQEIALPLMVAFSSYTLFDMEEDKQPLFFLIVCTCSVYFGIMTIVNGLGGFVIIENSGDTELPKNQIGAAYTAVAIIAAVFAMRNIKTWYRIAFIVLSLFNMYPAIYLGCRTAELCYGVVVLFLLYNEYGKKALFIAPVIVLIAILAGGEGLQSILHDSIIGGRDIHDTDDMTSGRISRFTESLSYFIEHPLFGFYGSNDSYGQMPANAHIFIILRLTKWGMIGAIPFIALYINIFKTFLRSYKTKYVLLSGPLFLAYVESLAEYAPPFGPGSCFIIVFFILGVFLRVENIKNI